MTYNINMFWDEEALVWCATSEDFPLALESPSFDKLIERVIVATPELLELNGKSTESLTLRFMADRIESIA